MVRLPHGRYWRGLAAVALVFLVINAAVAYVAVSRLIEGDRWVVHTYEVMDGLDQLLALMRQAETNNRTFLITGDEFYERSYQETLPLVWRQHEKLQALTADNASQQQRLSELKTLLARRLDRLQAAIAIRRERGFEAARDYIGQSAARETTESVVASAQGMKAEEAHLLAERGVTARRSALNVYVAMGVATLFAVLFSFASLQLLRRESEERRREQQASQRLRWSLQAARGAAWEWNLKSGEVWWSEELYDVWGLDAETKPDPAIAFASVNDTDRPRLEAALDAAMKGHIDARVEFRLMHPQRGLRWMASYVRPFYDANGTPERMLGVTLDITEQKHVQEEVRRGKELLEIFVDQAPASLAMFDRDMRYVLASKKWLQDSGLTGKQVVGRSHYELLPNMPERWKAVHQRGLAGESMKDDEEWTTPDGQKHSIRWEMHPWGDAGERTGGIIIFLEDTTERRRMDEALRESEERFRAIFDNAAVGVAQLAPDGTYLLVNHRFCSQLGYTAGELIGESFRLTTHPDDVGEEEPLFEELLRGERDSYSLEKRYLHKNGSPIWASVTRSVWRDEKGTPQFLVGVVEDVTRRKQAEAESAELLDSLKRSEARFRAVFENASVGIEQVGLNGRLLMVNSTLCRMLGYSREELTISSFADITEPEDLLREAKLLDELFAGKRESYGMDKRYIRRDRRPVWVHVESRLVRNEHGLPAYRISAIQDITDRQRAENAMLMAEKISAANKLAAALAHEIVNSLSAIGNACHLLDADPAIQGDSREFLEIAKQELLHVDEITKRALMVNRGGSTQTRVHLPAMLDGMIELYVAAIRRARVDVERRYRIENEVTIDTGLIKQVFTNLFTNALDAMQQHGGPLHIRVYAAQSRNNGSTPGVRIVVADAGVGIPKENYSRIFDPFFTTKGERGTGLGLWVTRGIILKAGGSIRIRSSQGEKRHGTCVSVFLPCSLGEAVPAPTMGMIGTAE